MFINRRMDKLRHIHINTTQYQKEKSEGGEWSGGQKESFWDDENTWHFVSGGDYKNM